MDVFREWIFDQLRDLGLIDAENHPRGAGSLPASTGAHKVLFDDGTTQGWSDQPTLQRIKGATDVVIAAAVGYGTAALEGTIPAVDGSGYTPVLAGAGAGNVSNGTHRYKFTYSFGRGETDGSGAPTPAVTVTDNTIDGQVTVAYPYTENGTTLIYRDKNNDGVYKFVMTGTDGPGPVVDNVADADLGATIPSVNTCQRQVGIIDGFLNSPTGDVLIGANLSFIGQDSPDGTGGSMTFRGGAGAVRGGDVFLIGGVGATTGGDAVLSGGQGHGGAGHGGKSRMTNSAGANRVVVDENGQAILGALDDNTVGHVSVAPSTNDHGSLVELIAGDGLVGDADGGSVTIAPGISSGAGANGKVRLQSAGGTDRLVIDDIGFVRSNNVLTLNLQRLPAPGSAAVTPQGTPGSTAYEYVVRAVVDYNGGISGLPATATTSTGNATLDGTNFNRISWDAVAGFDVIAYEVFRTVGGSAQGRIASVSAPALSYDDQDGSTAFDSLNAPTTGQIVDNSYNVGIGGESLGLMAITGGASGGYATLKAYNFTPVNTYKSADGSDGETASIVIGSVTLTVKNGLITTHA